MLIRNIGIHLQDYTVPQPEVCILNPLQHLMKRIQIISKKYEGKEIN
jgi:hypothetical protein